MSISDLIKRIPTATGADRVLDALIHRAITPHLADTVTRAENDAVAPGCLAGGNHAQPTEAPHYTGSIDAAMAMVRLPRHPLWTMRLEVREHGSRHGRSYEAEICVPSEEFQGFSRGNLALAICEAALMAKVYAR